MKILRTYKVQDNVNIYFNGDNEVRFRKGIWNYEEATLDLNWFESDNLRNAVVDVIKNLQEGKVVDIGDFHSKYHLISDENSCIIELFNA